METDRRFQLIWKSLGRRRKARIAILAMFGQRASDPETSWLVVQWARVRARGVISLWAGSSSS
jgi:hypothetical protein